MKEEEKPKKSNWKIWIMPAIFIILMVILVIVIKPKTKNTETNILEDIKCDDDKCAVPEIGTDVNIIVEGETDNASAPLS